MGQRLRVLMSAYACDPARGSEPGAGWAWASAAAEGENEVWLLTERHYRPIIDAELKRRPLPNLHPIYVDTPAWVGYTSDDVRGNRARYVAWQRRAARTAARLHDDLRFDVVHHAIMTGDWLPVGMARLTGVPFVWGPIGGYSPPTWKLWWQMGRIAAAKELARLGITGAGRKLFGDRVASRTSLLLAQNPDVARRFRAARRVVVEPNVALDYTQLPTRSADEAGDVKLAVYAGRLLPWKGGWLAVEALSRPSATGWRLEIYGDGPERDALAAQCRRLGVADRVSFRGEVPRDELMKVLATADALLFPSLHDSAGWIVAEAIGIGCPVVCLAASGPGHFVGPEQGIAVPPTGDVAGALARALATVRRPTDPSPRFDRNRLPALLDTWYHEVAAER
jgi:glycosyltransferase involved in cell wall biosynthesis